MNAFVIAMDNEADCVLARMTGISERVHCGRRVVRGTLCGRETAVVVSGVGKSNAAASAQLALDIPGVDALVNVGVAGGLLPTMKVGDVYQVESAVEYDFDLAEINSVEVGTLNEYSSRYLPLSAGGPFEKTVLGTGDRFNDSKADFEFLTADVKAGLRDMEGAAIVHTALRAGVPVFAFKSVSDVAGSGSTIEQYLANLKIALASLTAAVPAIAEAVSAALRSMKGDNP